MPPAHRFVSVRILNPQALCDDCVGENPTATGEFFWTDDSGAVWGCTGDMGYVDVDGFVYVLGRCGDCFASSTGGTVYCFDIENVILESEHVAQCEVVGLDTGRGYAVPVAQLVLEAGSDSPDRLLPEIHELCTQRLNRGSIPLGYKIVDTFPVKNNGKRDMDLIRQDRNGYVFPGKTLEQVDMGSPR